MTTELPMAQGSVDVNDRGWLPIETAPKDCDILLYCQCHGAVRGKWNDDRYGKKPNPYWTHDREKIWGVNAIRADQPTHWRPLPDAPNI